jgi:hypothetical protein
MSRQTAAVQQALLELAESFPGHQLEQRPDGAGGAWVVLDDLPLGPAFVPACSWVGFAIGALYPRADVYPHFVRPELRRADGQPLTTPLNPGHPMPGFDRLAVMVSRRSNRWDPAHDTAALKLHRILLWFSQQATSASADVAA